MLYCNKFKTASQSNCYFNSQSVSYLIGSWAGLHSLLKFPFELHVFSVLRKEMEFDFNMRHNVSSPQPVPFVRKHRR